LHFIHFTNQIENEYGAFGSEDKAHLEYLKSLLEAAKINELYVTSDSPLTARDKGAIPGVLQTANFYDDAKGQLDTLLELQPDKPILVMEYWSGWFDHWFEPSHNTRPSSGIFHFYSPKFTQEKSNLILYFAFCS
jgi:hypothetical protein